jgi:ABC-type transporter Mla subunit MlaD
MVSECVQEPLKKGIRTSAQSVSVTIASDQAAIPVSTTIVGVATEVTLALIKTAVQNLETDVANGVKIDPTDLATIVGYIDGLETAIASTNTKLDTVNSNLDTIEGYVDGLETLVGSTNTNADATKALATNYKVITYA